MRIEETIECRGRKMDIEVDEFVPYEGEFTEMTGIKTEPLYRIALIDGAEPFAYVSTNVDANTIEHGVAIDSNNLGQDERPIVEALIDADVLDGEVYTILHSGFCTYPLLRLSDNVIRQLETSETE